MFKHINHENTEENGNATHQCSDRVKYGACEREMIFEHKKSIFHFAVQYLQMNTKYCLCCFTMHSR